MIAELVFVGGSRHGQRMRTNASIVNVGGPKGLEMYSVRWLRRRFEDYSTKPATCGLQQAAVLYCESDERTELETEAMLLPSDWSEVDGTRRFIKKKKDVKRDR